MKPFLNERLIQHLKDARRIFLCTHISPDGDAIGSMLAAKLLLEGMGKAVTVCCADPVPAAYAVLPGANEVLTPGAVSGGFDAAMSLEIAADGYYARLGNGERLLVQPLEGCPPWLADDPAHVGQDPPLCALFTQPYTRGEGGKDPAPDVDPGRVRNEALLKALYGGDAAAVRRQCEVVEFLGERLLFNSAHGAAAALRRVAARVAALAADDPSIVRFVKPLAGTFCWRVISATKRLSAHSFAVAIDLNTRTGLYWQWSRHLSAQEVLAAREAYPQALIDAFEQEGFVWGGKWAHYDLMHFEYRPELLR